MKTYRIAFGNFMLGGLLVGGLVAWLLGTELGQCRMQSVADKLTIDTLSDEHRAMADKLAATKQQLDSAYTDLAYELGKKVDLTIPFKPALAVGGNVKIKAKSDKCTWYETDTRRGYTCLDGSSGRDVLIPSTQFDMETKPLHAEVDRSGFVLKDEAQGIKDMTDKFLQSGQAWPKWKEAAMKWVTRRK